MFIEIGGFIKKGLGQEIIKKFSKKKSVINLGIANGRAKDLFDIQEFGDASESEIITMIVRENEANRLFNQLFFHLNLDKEKNGIIFKSETISMCKF